MTTDAAAEFAELAVRLHGESGVEETVDLVVTYALKAVDAQHAGVLLVHRRGPVETAASTDAFVEELDRIQIECGEGPGVAAMADRSTVRVSDTLRDDRWREWARRIAHRGVRSVLTAYMSTGDTVVGTLNLYHSEPNAFDVDDESVASILARHAAVALASARQIENLWVAIDARKLIGQAQGMLMERYDLTADQAFSVLVRHSQQQNLKLRAVAELVVSKRPLPS